MTNDNQDALRCADALDAGENFYAESSMWFDSKLSDATADASDHLRRLVRESEELRSDRDSWADQASHRLKDWDEIRQQCEAKDALLRQAVEALEQSSRFVWHYAHNEATTRTAEACDATLAAIRQHLEGRA